MSWHVLEGLPSAEKMGGIPPSGRSPSPLASQCDGYPILPRKQTGLCLYCSLYPADFHDQPKAHAWHAWRAQARARAPVNCTLEERLALMKEHCRRMPGAPVAWVAQPPCPVDFSGPQPDPALHKTAELLLASENSADIQAMLAVPARL